MAKKKETWEVVEYKKKQVIPAEGYVAVYWEDGHFWTRKIDFLCLVEVTIETWGGDKSDLASIRRISSEHDGEEIVGLIFESGIGLFEIVNEAANFGGLAKRGDDFSKITACLKNLAMCRKPTQAEVPNRSLADSSPESP